jgi:hypothetical protein
LTSVDPPLNGAVILLEHVVQIRHWPMPAILGQIAFGFELRNSGRICGVAVGVDDSWRRMVRAFQRFDEKALGRDCVLLSREEKVDRRAGRIHRPVEVTPLAFDPDVRLVQAPAVIGRFKSRAQTSPQFRGVTLHPAPDGNVVDQKSALGKEFLHVTVRQREAQIPTDRQKDDLRLKLAPLEKTRNRRVQKERRASLSRRDCKVATLPKSRPAQEIRGGSGQTDSALGLKARLTGDHRLSASSHSAGAEGRNEG